ncbi:3-deoxy-D-manno-octulosonic acid transferase [Paracoccus spongiarum]|uniref:3-deoxy-D-manno-octulosonic acid transferase n=1 Tax=Paracoccus spongiarum TaxID=3064387 RepID=A0ABT9JBS3_9RHOB|nr:glycosyltransferase N-terminal domain-containing protein [Paracoccus sp. 2205BS29-5]MDP5307257.1 glycosyltransferase N-terminal domain-containing protein [Paracoccus sp. 2205BS29-5]
MIYAATTRIAEGALRLRARLSRSDSLRERLVGGAPPAAADIWVHGASVGELTSARPIIEALASDLRLIVTTNSETGRDMVAGWGLSARLAPLDLPGALDRFLNAVTPALQITLENEFWPLRSRLLGQRGIAQAMIGARMSQRSATLWARLPGVIQPMLQRLAAVSAQDGHSEARLLQLGLPQAALLPRLDLKLLTPARIAPPEDNALRDRTLLAASTHEGEEAAVLDAWMAARREHPDLRLILATRHPQRGDEVAALIVARGLPLARRSAGAAATTDPLLLADTLGEMDRWYAQAGICLVGGSLTDRGGHTPWEPAAHRCAILTGPHVGNFLDAYAALTEAGAARQVSAGDLAAILAALRADPAVARRMGRAARDVLDDRTGAPGALVDRLRDLAQRPARSDMKGR